ncbi:MAG: CGNR zinc finger domain-containing protein [Balneolaceae bacterium]|nr:CGNR zinc finger domain-containing protein [Balneolaceae bacterium]
MEERSIDTLSLDGGWLCLNFINTVDDHTAEQPFEYLSTYNDLLDWSVKVEMLPLSEARQLKAIAKNDPKKAGQVLSTIIEARKELYHLFWAITKDESPDDKTLAAFNELLENAMSQLKIRIEDELEVSHEWKDKTDLIYPLHPIVKSAYNLLTSDKLDRVKECGACRWLFLDQSKNKSRKWCSMENCGSNVKAKRYYHRNKKKN